jgi:Putative beta-barrel porin-2, OmpL-like. bbp2
MNKKLNGILKAFSSASMAMVLIAGAQTPVPPMPAATAAATAPVAAATAAPAATDAPAAAPIVPPTPPTWSVGPMDISGFIDGYYSYNTNRPTDAANGQMNDLYNFSDKTDMFNLSAAKLTLNHDPDPIGAHVDFIYGRTNDLINAVPANSSSADQLNYIEQAFLSLKPIKAKGFELDFGKFVTSAGAEVIESKDNWNYSRSLLFSWAIPYWHFGARASMPVSKTDTIGLQLVNGWNNVSKSNGGVTVGLNNALTKPKYAWNLNYYGGPENANTTSGFRNLIDTTILLTPTAKFNAYINYDYGQNRDGKVTTGSITTGDTNLNHWQGVAVAARGQVTGKAAFAGRYEYYLDPNGFMTGTAQHLQEFTGTYEYKWVEGLLARAEYRGDFSNVSSFHQNSTSFTNKQSTFTLGMVAFFGPKR